MLIRVGSQSKAVASANEHALTRICTGSDGMLVSLAVESFRQM